MPDFDQAFRILSAPENRALLTNIKRGLEKESLRVTADGSLATTPHPNALGSALTHPWITTDYSEALLEMITPPVTNVDELLATLERTHQFIYQTIGDEMLWVHSMPCSIARDEDVPIADYGTSNIGRMKKIYREGLGHRYGRVMQTIAGIHYNWSVPEECLSLLQTASGDAGSFHGYKTQRYFDLIRNFRRRTWLLLYLFGAAPAVCRSYVKGRTHRLQPFGDDDHSLHAPYGTSLRMGDLGYQSNAQESLIVCYNNLDSYIDTLRQALTMSYPPYEAIGLKDGEGNYLQLSTHLLQIENEFYSTIRPKRTTRSGETPIRALSQRGVEYIEVRCVDLNPFQPLGIDGDQIRFLDIFLLHCLMMDSAPADNAEYRAILENQKRIVYDGRNPALTLHHNGGERSVRDWGESLFDQMAPVARLLDDANGSDEYRQVLARLRPRLSDPSQTPSAQILDQMAVDDITYFQLALRHAREHREQFLAAPLPDQALAAYQHMARKSLDDQAAIEAGDNQSFEAFLAGYYSQYQL
ncbi:MAG: glutamate--cysteine ligase [Porticoccaceae bacterium]|nr:glutamate--cysteine ligase [Porticoccaceae bacterium]